MARIYFGIPLRARGASSNWTMVQENLLRTVRSLLSQESEDVRILIAGHDRPGKLKTYLEDGRVHFIDVSREMPVPDSVEGFNADKAVKKNWLGYAVREMEPEPLYYMHMDADDLLHRRLARYIAESDNKTGYVIERGWMVDVANRQVAPMNEKIAPFYAHCGSCALVHFTPDELPRSPTHFRSNFSKFRNHSRYLDVARDQGKTLTPFSQNVGAYLVNHGENNRNYRGMIDRKVRYVQRHAVKDPAEVARLARNFHDLGKLLTPPAETGATA